MQQFICAVYGAYIFPNFLYSAPLRNLAGKHCVDEVQNTMHLPRFDKALLHNKHIDPAPCPWEVVLAVPWNAVVQRKKQERTGATSKEDWLHEGHQMKVKQYLISRGMNLHHII